jgi:hypothetical protein
MKNLYLVFTALLLLVASTSLDASAQVYCDQAQAGAGFPSDLSCQNTICASDAYCCNTQWDGICASSAALEPACAACLSSAAPAYCDQAQGTAGFPSNLTCQNSVCSYDPFCCNNTWDAICASEAVTDAACASCLSTAVQVFCDQAQGTAGFPSNLTCQNSVCSYDPFCCNNTWDAICASEAVTDGACAACLSTAIPDCNGDPAGTAFLDNCNVCVGGNTGLTACVQDCNGVFGGTASIDNCGTCVGGNTGLTACVQDCNGVFGGTASIDNCGTCVGGNTGLTACVQDCNGDFGGTAVLDNCNVCVGGNTGLTACVQGCTNPTATNFNPAATVDDGSCVFGPANNLCAGAITVSCGNVVNGTTVGATNADGPATCVTTLNTAPGLWYRITGTGDNVTASLIGSAYDTKIGVFSGSCGALVCVTGNDDFGGLQSQVTFPSVAGTDYYIYVTGFGTAAGAFTLTLTCAPPPPPPCASAIAIACGDVVTGTTVGSTADPAAGTCVTGLTTAPGVYYVVQGTGLNITASLCGSAYDTKIGVFSGTCGTPLACVIGNDDFCGLQSQVTFASTAGVNYYIYVTGFSTQTGNYTLSVTCDFLDCNNDLNGTAVLDNCNVCVEGNTGLTACVQDCNGDFGGTAVLDNCNICVGGNTGLTACVQDCNGDFGGTAVLDNCGICVGGNTGLTACVQGCTDPAASNFNPAATVDDGSCVFGPANNLCAGAITVSCGNVVNGTTVGATNADGPATCVTTLNTAPGLWYRITGTGDNVTASLIGSAYDTKIGVFSGSCGALVCVTGNDDFGGLQSQVTFPSVAGTDYYIYVTGFVQLQVHSP